jgi:hypothetical protein
MKYATEEQMSHRFRYSVLAGLPKSAIVCAEVRASMGIPDYVVLEHVDDQEVVTSYELKLTNWRRALRQAFRYRTFANQSYVVLDEATCSPAVENVEVFRQYNIGLASFDADGCFRIHHRPSPNSAFSEYSYSRVIEEIKSHGEMGAANSLPSERSLNSRVKCNKRGCQ